MFEWWLIEKDVHDKMIFEIIPRCAELNSEPFSSLYILPKIRLPQRINVETVFWAQWDIGILEINGKIFKVFIN